MNKSAFQNDKKMEGSSWHRGQEVGNCRQLLHHKTKDLLESSAV